MWLSPAASWGQPFCRSVSYTISCQIPDFPSSHRISVLHQPLIKPCATARVWRARNCLKRSTRCLRFHSQSHGQYIVFISLTCVCLFPKRIWSSNRMMCVTRHFTRGRALGSPHRRATCEKASKTVRKERTWPPPPRPPPCGQRERQWGGKPEDSSCEWSSWNGFSDENRWCMWRASPWLIVSRSLLVFRIQDKFP